MFYVLRLFALLCGLGLALTAGATENVTTIPPNGVEVVPYDGRICLRTVLDLAPLDAPGFRRAGLRFKACPSVQEEFIECEVAAWSLGQPVLPDGRVRYPSKVASTDDACLEMEVDVSPVIAQALENSQSVVTIVIGRLSADNAAGYSFEVLDSGVQLILTVEQD